MPIHGLNKFKFQGSGERQDRARVTDQLMNELAAGYIGRAQHDRVASEYT